MTGAVSSAIKSTWFIWRCSHMKEGPGIGSGSGSAEAEETKVNTMEVMSLISTLSKTTELAGVPAHVKVFSTRSHAQSPELLP